MSLTTGQKLAYAIPGLALAWLIPPMYAILGDFYLRYTEATAAGIGTAMMMSKIVDAITDPPVGYLSDKTESRWGARKPWIFVGLLMVIPSFHFFFSPPEDAGNLYFALGLVLYYLCYTLIKIPMRAWLGELSPDYSERSKIWSWMTICLLLGGLLIMLLPIVFSSPLLPWFDSPEFTPEVMSFIGWVGGVGIVATLLVSLWVVPGGERNPGESSDVKQFFNILLVSKPFQHFMLGYGLSALGYGISYAVMIVGLTSYYGFADRLPIFMLAMILIQVASIPVWERIAERSSKHETWARAWVICACFMPVLWLFGANSEYFWAFVACAGVISIMQAPHMLFPVTIISDIVDYDTLKHRTSRSGNFFAVYTFVDKVLHAIGFGIGYYIIALFGYDAKAEVNTDLAVFGLKFAILGVPAVMFLLSALVLFKFPINRHRHSIIRRRIEQRARREKARAPQSSHADFQPQEV
ncbi:MFS transporter [Pseudomaricurvus alkylphenolicus]|uniref:MFS transporter n=1 Tax=Pseudomaricurvus alkylphenolicus TaxID=1306991 RepID=UPI001423AFAA|nr:MFS transporter [Pseudomaricurvus alkylphenolicus]NIB42482.1 MFS transporter [Pseudomaricurvus alkylphenolicus]